VRIRILVFWVRALCSHRVDVLSGNALDLDSGGVRFESWPGH
jgi:hypothetical protein